MPTITLRPSGVGVYTEFNSQSPVTGSHWDKCDEVIADDFTTTVNAVNDNVRDFYDLPDSGIPIDKVITNVKIYARVYAWTAGSCKVCFNDGVGDYYGSNQSPAPDSWQNIDSGDMVINPRIGLAWTLTEINALQIGLQVTNWGETFQMTQIYVEVTYSDPPPTGNRGSMGLMAGVGI